MINYTYKKTNGQFLIIGTGGIFDTDDVIMMLRHGASLVQIYSSLVFEGPGLTKKLNKSLTQYLESHGYNHVSEIIGLDVK